MYATQRGLGSGEKRPCDSLNRVCKYGVALAASCSFPSDVSGSFQRSYLVSGCPSRISVHRPSRDQSKGNMTLDRWATTCSSPIPLAGLRKSTPEPKRVNKIVCPSGDHTGCVVSVRPAVNRVVTPRSVSINQRSCTLPEKRAIAIRRSSGEGRKTPDERPSVGSPSSLSRCPVRSHQASCISSSDLPYSKSPVPDALRYTSPSCVCWSDSTIC